ncbi:YafY family transcriptional regulator [Jannaschia sp. Os4]|uniref:helix-turn-helix transcriptional regulator n=1 Tax=Jannaschia sp. Os4 TaxID=2807617 RepID=UPI00193A2B87|nr:YafY family protein [Jannaschia sp. Os4]MBM2575286.1 YafY family transcriptional regulator [Jannaschia sp. Os4]
MRRAERLYRLIDEMRGRGVRRAADLAAALEVSERTVYRDVAHLQGSGLPIEGAAGVGYLLRPGFDLPPVTLTHDQLDALAVGLAFVEGTEDAVLAEAAREVRAKIEAGLPEGSTLRDAPFRAVRSDAAPHADAIRHAIRHRAVLRLRYRDGGGAETEREVNPLIVWSMAEGRMVSGWCALRDGFRTFRLDRIVALEPTGATFEPTPETDLAAFLAQDAHAP